MDKIRRTYSQDFKFEEVKMYLEVWMSSCWRTLSRTIFNNFR
jgi:transposase-like protein